MTCCRWVDASDVRLWDISCSFFALRFAFDLVACYFVCLLIWNHSLPSQEALNQDTCRYCYLLGLTMIVSCLGLRHSGVLPQCM